jgi:hypothetical protein
MNREQWTIDIDQWTMISKQGTLNNEQW